MGLALTPKTDKLPGIGENQFTLPAVLMPKHQNPYQAPVQPQPGNSSNTRFPAPLLFATVLFASLAGMMLAVTVDVGRSSAGGFIRHILFERHFFIGWGTASCGAFIAWRILRFRKVTHPALFAIAGFGCTFCVAFIVKLIFDL